MIGATSPLISVQGTIRGDFAVKLRCNIIHGSDSLENAQKEICLWFEEKELIHWKPCTSSWLYV